MASLRADLLEIQQLAAECKRPRVKAYLDVYAAQLQELIDVASAPAAVAVPASIPVSVPRPMPMAPPVPPVPLRSKAARPSEPAVNYTSITGFAWDQDDYGKEPANVYVYLTAGFDGIGEAKDCVKCEFGRRSFDLRVVGFHGKSYRLRKENLEKEIDPAQSKVVVKKNKITLTMRKVKGSYGYDHWLDLVAKRGAASAAEGKAAEADPSAGLMDLMKQMYDEGDDSLKKTLGEAMLKSRQGQLQGGGAPSDLSDDSEF